MMSTLLSFVSLVLPLGSAFHGSENNTAWLQMKEQLAGECVEPATCEAPVAKYSWVGAVQSRQQWGDSGGFCGALSIQAIAMSYGAYISQDKVRKAAGPGGGHGDEREGYEILFTNIQGCLDKLKLSHEDWDWQNSTKPQANNYKKWLKGQLINQHPVVWMIMCKGDSHQGYPAARGHLDHIEPVWGIFSNHSLEDSTVYDDDVLVHGADYGATRYEPGPSLYRAFHTLEDSTRMDGNCAIAQSGYGRNEYYPCIDTDEDYGYAITGQAGASGAPHVPLSLAVDVFDEPDVREYQRPARMHGTVTVTGPLKHGASYTIYRWNNYEKIPDDPSDYAATASSTHEFKATEGDYKFKDPDTILSNEMAYYRCVSN